MNIKLILFDVDGTLVDSYPQYKTIISKILPNYKIKTTSEILKATFPMTIDQTIKYLKLNPQVKEDMLRDYLEISKHLPSDQGEKMYPKIGDALLNLVNNPKLKLGIVTSRGQSEVDSLINEFPILKHFNVIVSSETVDEHKPSPAPINYALKHENVNPDQAVYIGDAKTDYQAAINANVNFVAALWGSNHPEHFSKIKNKAKDFEHALQLINNL